MGKTLGERAHRIANRRPSHLHTFKAMMEEVIHDHGNMSAHRVHAPSLHHSIHSVWPCEKLKPNLHFSNAAFSSSRPTSSAQQLTIEEDPIKLGPPSYIVNFVLPFLSIFHPQTNSSLASRLISYRLQHAFLTTSCGRNGCQARVPLIQTESDGKAQRAQPKCQI